MKIWDLEGKQVGWLMSEGQRRDLKYLNWDQQAPLLDHLLSSTHHHPPHQERPVNSAGHGWLMLMPCLKALWGYRNLLYSNVRDDRSLPLLCFRVQSTIGHWNIDGGTGRHLASSSWSWDCHKKQRSALGVSDKWVSKTSSAASTSSNDDSSWRSLVQVPSPRHKNTIFLTGHSQMEHSLGYCQNIQGKLTCYGKDMYTRTAIIMDQRTRRIDLHSINPIEFGASIPSCFVFGIWLNELGQHTLALGVGKFTRFSTKCCSPYIFYC